MNIGIIALLVFCAGIMLGCRQCGVDWKRTTFATAIASVTLYFSFRLTFDLRLQHDMKIAPHDGQSAIDVVAFAILVAPIVTIIVVLLFLWITKSEQPHDDH